MSKTEVGDVKKITALSVGVVVAVGFAGWNVSNALAPPAPRASPPPARPASASAAEAEEGLIGETPEPKVDQAAGSTEPPAAASPAAEVTTTEASLAMEVDPFNPLPEAAPPPPAVMAAADSGSPGQGVRTRVPVLPGLDPFSGRVFGMRSVVHPAAQAAPVEEAPPLVGTLLGDRPSAVFRGEASVMIVPVGETVGAWRVVTVGHGRVKLRSAAGTRFLSVRPGTPAGAVRATRPVETRSASESEAVEAPVTMAAMPEAMPAPATPVLPPVEEAPVAPAGESGAAPPAPAEPAPPAPDAPAPETPPDSR